MAAATRFSCHPGGQCSPDPNGKYATLEECRASCETIGLKDLDMIAYEYNPELAIPLAPSARGAVLKRITGVEIAEADQELALLTIATDDLEQMIKCPPLWPYLQYNYSQAEYREALRGAGTISAFQELIRLGELPALDGAPMTEEQVMDSPYVEYFGDYGHYYGRSLYQYLETLDQPEVLACADVTFNNPELLSYLCEVGKVKYNDFHAWMAAPSENGLYVCARELPTLLKMHPQFRIPLQNWCRSTLNSAAPPHRQRLAQDFLEDLAAVGMVVEREWVSLKYHQRKLVYRREDDAFIRLCVDGTLSVTERLNRAAELSIDSDQLLDLIQEYNRTPQVQLPSLLTLWRIALYPAKHAIFQRISDSELINLVREEAAQLNGTGWIQSLFTYIGTLPLERRVHLREELRRLGHTL